MIGQKRRKGFTLIELMVVITIIAIIAGVAIVAINGALFTARQKACSVNMTNIYKALTNYALSYSGSFPVSMDFAEKGLEGRGDDKSFGANCLFYLFQEGNVEAKQFLCPAQTHRATGIRKIPLGTTYADAKTTYMFDNSKPNGDRFCDYGFDPRHRQDSGTPGIVIVADRPPTTDEVTKAGTSADAKNSPNHNRKGQNCLLVSGSVEWYTTTLCGAAKDDIYIADPISDDSCIVP